MIQSITEWDSQILRPFRHLQNFFLSSHFEVFLCVFFLFLWKLISIKQNVSDVILFKKILTFLLRINLTNNKIMKTSPQSCQNGKNNYCSSPDTVELARNNRVNLTNLWICCSYFQFNKISLSHLIILDDQLVI